MNIIIIYEIKIYGLFDNQIILKVVTHCVLTFLKSSFLKIKYGLLVIDLNLVFKNLGTQPF